MREHSTKVTRDIISGLAAYIQSQFISSGTQNGELLMTLLVKYTAYIQSQFISSGTQNRELLMTLLVKYTALYIRCSV